MANPTPCSPVQPQQPADVQRATPERPQTQANRPSTARLDTTSQLETFHPDGLHLDHLDGGEEYVSDDDEDVFAFERPTTAAPLCVLPPHPPQTIIHSGPAINPLHARNLSNLSAKPSLVSTSSYIATTDGGFTTDTIDADDSDASLNPKQKMRQKALRMRHLYKKDTLEVIPGSREGSQSLTDRVTAGIGRGVSTIPDGRTTRGDGFGNMRRSWTVEQTPRVHEEGEEEDSPYEEVRASVSNIDDPDMPGKWSLVPCPYSPLIRRRSVDVESLVSRALFLDPSIRTRDRIPVPKSFS